MQQPLTTWFQGYKNKNFLRQIQFLLNVSFITSVHYQAILHIDNEDLQVFLKSKMLHKITKKLITEVHGAQQTM